MKTEAKVELRYRIQPNFNQGDFFIFTKNGISDKDPVVHIITHIDNGCVYYTCINDGIATSCSLHHFQEGDAKLLKQYSPFQFEFV